MTALYLHVPFCRSKCLYCDFYSAGLRIADWEKYLATILLELENRHEELPEVPSTLYIGGGTPSLIPPNFFNSFVSDINSLLGKNKEWLEFTLEVNPEDVNAENCEIWKVAGVNRLSMGLQSLNNSELKKIGRRHSSSEAIEALKTAKNYFPKISADVIFALPGQSPESYRETLEKVISTEVGHISSYALMLEPGTPFEVLVRRNRLSLPSEEEWGIMYDLTCNLLGQAGYERYEISNFALPQQHSIHNYSYWTGKPYLGLGPGAHSYDGGSRRRSNPADLKSYLNFFMVDDSIQNARISSPIIGNQNKKMKNKYFYIEEILTDNERREEFILTRLRTAKGLSLTEFEASFGSLAVKSLLDLSSKYINTGHLTLKDSNLFFTKEGFAISDLILSSIL
ncbi:MAG: radical SAM family heme chaperone HemW [Muribaculaceae bacterium]|nr:radical SAM family heme chaperone HemW [Muribaculaceae bacterium]